MRELMKRAISNHPFIFIILWMVLASCCLFGGMLANTGTKQSEEAPSPTIRSVTTNSMAGLTQNTGPIETTTGSARTSTETPASTLLATFTMVPVVSTIEPTTSTTPGPLMVHFIDVGQGDAILIIAPDGQTMLIDGGSSGSGVDRYIRGIGIGQIDIMVSTHPHEDHLGGLIQVLGSYPVEMVVTNGSSHTTTTFENFLDAVLSTDGEFNEVSRGDQLSLGEVVIDVLHPLEVISGNLNENSIVLRMTYHQTTFLFMGDASAEAELILLGSGLSLDADILKIGHHGSCSASTPAFLRAVSPEIGIYSAGLDNQYGHPCADTIISLEQIGALVFGTPEQGDIIVTVTTDGYSVIGNTGELTWR